MNKIERSILHWYSVEFHACSTSCIPQIVQCLQSLWHQDENTREHNSSYSSYTKKKHLLTFWNLESVREGKKTTQWCMEYFQYCMTPYKRKLECTCQLKIFDFSLQNSLLEVVIHQSVSFSKASCASRSPLISSCWNFINFLLHSLAFPRWLNQNGTPASIIIFCISHVYWVLHTTTGHFFHRSATHLIILQI